MTMLLNCGVIVASAENINMQVDENIQSTFPVSEEYYVSPIQPGSDAWDELSIQEKYMVASIDAADVSIMTTEAVLLSVLNYPFIINIYAYDNINDGIEAVSEYCMPLAELLLRDDAFLVITDYLQACVACEATGTSEYYVAKRIQQYILDMAEVSPRYIIDPITGQQLTYLSTPNGSRVLVFVNIAWDDYYTYEESYTQSLRAEEVYGVVMVRNPSRSYNCHSYAWHSTASNNPYWMDDPSAYISDGSYVSSEATIGNKITYRKSDGTYWHSGIVTGSGEITSKWGMMGVFEHGITNNPYYNVAPTINYWTLA